ncbi:MAG: TetR/AcrR family transcriptional regulator [SAR86 cluster bacterium]|jgi:AcrR family transcriptional regulator|nr:TetR/AcrR family transcriptional regulator [SAR86 cluster bacterium]
MNLLKKLPKIPQQERSKKKRALILETSKRIIKDLGPDALTLKNVAERANLKRPSLYKLFPSVESIIFSLSELYIKELLNLIKSNFNQVKSQELEYYLKIFIDVSSIFLNKQRYLSFLFINLNMNFHSIERSLNHQEHLAISFSTLLNEQNIKFDGEKIMIAVQIIFAVLGHGLRSKGLIDSRTINDAKRSALAVISI